MGSRPPGSRPRGHLDARRRGGVPRVSPDRKTIVQLIPADGKVRALHRFKDEDGTEEWTVPVVAWGLTYSGAVRPLSADPGGNLEPVDVDPFDGSHDETFVQKVFDDDQPHA
jgi:hypothetical protein